ncbi:cyclopropane-fatty-acyl-phospholipid synthase family protein [Gilvimarinus agarilyticus]|uniref:SAM-dependent methyltransferase n=1 Tax=Gilvimarinus sp. 2_MG-2023 TaxID=3062666 RepID=UPI001C087C39|nr:cyclopropane-fatty-acyl-phospholipid synthase family protein [Gilvimarinus sp. 2_MG-2023]MBU2887134.1 cyclopropane-fatty-acyl-phospholipid synthase family protein [Gilvimarinus agarilyticus]MDO6571793.1 cyclopropane-fatty-acyl-phospholipid synthase family protein [Gilvimarinus sp. 2_MG-2023]
MTNASAHRGINELSGHRAKVFNKNHRIAKKLVLAQLGKLKIGCLRIHDTGQCTEYGQSSDEAELVADIYVHDQAAYRDVAFAGSVGSGEAYMSGYWSSPDLTRVVRIFVLNLSTLDAMDQSQSWWSKAALSVFSYFNRNSKEGAKRNISAHYDLSNEFFSLFLDHSMMYSSAIFPNIDSSLDEAAQYKLQVVCEKLQLKPSDHLLEIGTGWGGLAAYAASQYGCRVTTTTISKEQHDRAVERVVAQGLQDKVTVLQQDYRDLQGTFDKLVSIEMIEAVGHEHYAGYFRQCGQLLKPDGLMLIQAITIADQRYELAKNSVDFIQRYIFPGGGLPSTQKITELVTRHTALNLIGFDEIGSHYAQTLRLWRQRFWQQMAAVRELGFDERFIRMWDYYLCYCEGGFMERTIGTGQYVFAGPEYRF